MGITTTSPVRMAKPPGPCEVCGRHGGLFVKSAQGGLVHAFDEHRDGPPPMAEDALFAHDPLDMPEPGSRPVLGGADIRALERLRRLGYNQTLESAPSWPGSEVSEEIRVSKPPAKELKTEVVRWLMGSEAVLPIPGGPVLPPSVGKTTYGGVRKTARTK